MIFSDFTSKRAQTIPNHVKPGERRQPIQTPRTQHSIMTTINKCEAAMLQASRDGSERMR